MWIREKKRERKKKKKKKKITGMDTCPKYSFVWKLWEYGNLVWSRKFRYMV